MVSVQDPAEIKRIYDFTGSFRKSDFYHVLMFYAKGKPVPTIFATQDEVLHRRLRKPIAPTYSMSNLISLERYVNVTMSILFNQLESRFATDNIVCDLDKWLQWFAFDVMGELTFSRRLGFLERGADVDGIIDNIWQYFRRASPVSQIPWVDYLWRKNPLLQRLRSVRANPVVSFAVARVQERQKNEAADQMAKVNENDFLARFMAAIRNDSSIPPFALTVWTTSNVAAGSDTTAILLRTVFHSLLANPESMSRLLAELDHAAASGRLSNPATWREARELPYLDAVIKEAGRLHPPFGLPLERVVPASGATVCGQALPPGTVVGMSAWVVHRDPDTFGHDCNEWKPERWIGISPEKRRTMENALLTFGAGHRVCLGKNIAHLEVYKLIPSLLQTFTFQWADPSNRHWKVENRWFVNQTGLKVLIKRRESTNV
ncbi:Cytochrome P450 [Macrophomina phaseolina MS6]|uniref:Cytochrome P450 n=1 Tax=Macrophomina phaseolina (strain MS6) TaxID=1126212 RepID=K2SC13_MACPH|nr:Cytochrome P450 [Macrophomina phaseolina MS6]